MRLIVSMFNGFVSALIAFGLFSVLYGGDWAWGESARFGLIYVGVSLIITSILFIISLALYGVGRLAAERGAHVRSS